MRIVLRPALLSVLTTVIAFNGMAQTTRQSQRWPPSMPAARSEDYAGSAACVACHRAQARQTSSEMGLSVMLPAQSGVFSKHSQFSYQRGPYTYTLRRTSADASLNIADGHGKIAVPVFAAVGSGKTWQAYLLERDGAYFRAPLDYLTSQSKLVPDPEADSALPKSLQRTLGKQLTPENLSNCFRCHSPVSVFDHRVDLTRTAPGIQCETCHGPGAGHVAGMRAHKRKDSAIFNPARLSAEDRYDFCNQCHASAAAMRAQNPHGVQSVTSPAYRLETSRCWSRDDARIGCSTCHDAHAPMVRKTAAYDIKCLACHRQSGAPRKNGATLAKACPAGKHDCVSCHMPRYSIPNNPLLFTDHRIRIAAAGAPYPE